MANELLINKIIVMKGINLRILLLLLLVQRFSLESKQLSQKSTTDVILTDIREAFKTVTNNTKLLNQIIPQMYDSVMQQPKFVLLFEIPDDSVKSGYSMWTMERNDLVDPVFPNLTNEYMRTQLNKNRLTFVQNVNINNDTGTLKNESQTHAANVWDTLGLHGWAGSIASGHVESDTNNDYPSRDILIDMGIEQEYENGVKQEDDNVYIARANDPFGSSIKWELRNSSDRLKRDVLTLYSMIQCYTGCQPLIYKGYGCYCGFSGAGVPTDGIDRCCRVHDKCYEYSNCISYLEYFTPYIWKCYRRKPLCAIDHGEFGGPGSCAARLCQCDLQLSHCLRRFTCPRRRAICYTSRARRLQNFLFTI